MTIQTTIVSKDRPTQLDLLLQSIEKNGNGLFGPIHILYKCSNNKYYNGYELLTYKYDHDDNFVFFEEQDFQTDFRFLTSPTNTLSCFFTDDDIIYRKILLSYKELLNYFNTLKLNTFSLRLGENTYTQDPYSNPPTRTRFPLKTWSDGKINIWSIASSNGFGNFAYPLSVDGHIHKSEEIYKIITKLEYENPNFYEGKAQHEFRQFPTMACLKQSCVINTPLNRVQSTFTNRFGQFFPHSQEELNEKFLQGYRFDINKIEWPKIIGAHQEIPLSMYKE